MSPGVSGSYMALPSGVLRNRVSMTGPRMSVTTKSDGTAFLAKIFSLPKRE